MKNNEKDSVSKFQPQKTRKVKASIVKISKFKPKIVTDEHMEDGKLTLDELREFISNNISISIEEDREDYYDYDGKLLRISLLMEGKEISSDSFRIN